MKILVVGDSHIGVWKLLRRELNKIQSTNVIMSKFSGATCSGLIKMNSSISQAGYKIFKLLEKHNDFDNLVLCFGHVDLDYVYYSKISCQIKNCEDIISIHDYADRCVKKYFQYIDEVILKNYPYPEKIIIQCLHPPTLNDQDNSTRLSSKSLDSLNGSILVVDNKCDSRILLSHLDRTNAFIYFNKLIESECVSRGMKSINVLENMLSSEHIIDNKYLRDRYLDVHVDETKIVDMYMEQL